MTDKDFLITHTTALSVQEVMDKLEKSLHEKNVKIFARISHSQAALEAGLTMQAEEVLVFGNPKVGTALMLDNPAIGIELPLKVVAWQDTNGTQVAYQNLDRLAEIFAIKRAQETIELLKKFMANLIQTNLQ